MVKFSNILLFTVLLAFGCKEKDIVPEPDNLIAKDKMIEVLTDIHLVEGARTGLVIMGDTAVGVNEHYKAFYVKHNITQAQFDSSFVYYSKNPIIFDVMYEKVIENLSVIESEVDGD